MSEAIENTSIGRSHGRLTGPIFLRAVDHLHLLESRSARSKDWPVNQEKGSAPAEQQLGFTGEFGLTALGRVVKTIFILHYLSDPALRHRVQLQLNRGEARHELLGRRLFLHAEEIMNKEIMNKASCLSLLSNAVLVWNTLRITEIVNQLRAAGHAIADQDLA